MPAIDEITPRQLARQIGLPGAPRLIDLRPDTGDPRSLPTARRLESERIAQWGPGLRGQHVVLYCQDGGAPSHGAAAWLRAGGVTAEVLSGGFAAWLAAGELLIRTDKIPPADDTGASIWVTRARPKIVRIACPWLIRRFVDPDARFLFVPAAEVAAVADRFGATPFDTGHGTWKDDGTLCTFDVMLREFGLHNEALARLAEIVRGADTGQPELTPQSGGLLAASLGFSRMYRDDNTQLDAAMSLYDALYRWSRDAFDETHG